MVGEADRAPLLPEAMVYYYAPLFAGSQVFPTAFCIFLPGASSGALGPGSGARGQRISELGLWWIPRRFWLGL